jgi:hypothetical protein
MNSFIEQAQNANKGRRIAKKKESFEAEKESSNSTSEEMRQEEMELKPYTIRLPDKQRKILEKHFKHKGIPPAVGVRSIILEWIERHGL